MSTRLYITSINEESNAIARSLMQDFGVTVGLAIMCLVLGLLLGVLVGFCRFVFAKKTNGLTWLTIFVVDGFLAWFIAGSHFAGGTSWFWLVPEISRHLLGAGIYFVLLYASFLLPEHKLTLTFKNS